MPGRRVRKIPANLVTPYFPVCVPPDASGSLRPDILDPSIPAILGGSNPALKPEEEWPACGTCERHLIPYIQINLASLQTPEVFRRRFPGDPPEPGRTAVLQVFVCAEDENACCFEQNVVSDPDGGSWLVRVVCLASTDPAAVGEMRAEMDEGTFFIPERAIVSWAAGNPEVEHEEVNWDDEEAFYKQHEPAEGLKMFGWPIRDRQILVVQRPMYSHSGGRWYPCRIPLLAAARNSCRVERGDGRDA